jgi:hypothetical protein
MGLTKFPNGISNMGLPVIGGGGYVTTGTIYFVHDSTGSNGNNGTSSSTAFASIDYAVGQCTANKGDIIFAMPGHTEDIAAAGDIDLDVAGISVVGLGQGTSRPTITYSTDTGADMDVDAANITVDNMYFDMTGIDAVVAGIDVNSTNFTMRNCTVLMADSGGQAVLGILTVAGAGGMKVLNCKFLSPNAGADAAIRLTGTPDDMEVGGCYINGDFADACIHNPTGNVVTNVFIHDCILKNNQTGDHSIELVSACTGILARNLYHNDMTQATGVDPGSCFSFECYHDDVINTSAIVAPAVT